METLAERLHNLMKNNIVSFTFRKKDGTIRHATGTRNLSLVRAAYGIVVPTPTHAEQPNSYFDIDKEDWRSYIPANVLSIDGYGFLATPTNNGFNAKQKTIEVELPPTFGKGTEEKIRKSMEELDKGISFGGGIPFVGTPTIEKGIGVALPISGVGGKEMTIDDFAKLVAKYVVAELAERLTK